MMNYIKTILMVGLVMFLSGCYDDKGGNDYDGVLPNVIITLPETTYSGSIGDKISIKPTVTTDIDASDLQYIWEVCGERYNAQGRKTFVPLVADSLQGMNLCYTCKLDSNVSQMNKNYDCRLHVKQKSTGRDFYSTSTFTITIEGITGLLVLDGDDSQCDVGIFTGQEFMPSTSSVPANPSATTGLYSMNTGSKIPGKGISIIQPHPSYIPSKNKDNCRIVVMTDRTARVLNRSDLSLFGDWNSLFYLQGPRAVNAGQPKGFVVDDSWSVAFDGDDVFMVDPSQQASYLFATFTPTTDVNGHTFTFAPFLTTVSTSGVQRLMYVNSVDGKSQKGFAGYTNGSLQNAVNDLVLLDTKTDAVPFNPGDMKASLKKMSLDTRGHVVAVMKGDADNASFPHQYFLADLMPNAASSGGSGYQGVPQQEVGMASLTGVDAAQSFEFGKTVNEMYYATAKQVYHYGLDGTTLTAARPLQKTDGSTLSFAGTITMMKMLNSPNVTTHNTDEVLLVATWDGSQSHLYALHLDEMTGNVTTLSLYDATTVSGWNFKKIYDVNIKSL